MPADGGCSRAQWTIPQRGAAKIGGKNRQAPPDLVIRFNSCGAKGMIAKPLPGRCGWFTGEHKALRTYIGEERPAPAIRGVVRWRAGDLTVQVREESGRERIPR